jgi:rhodanese-related sulfurtransferase
MPFTRQTINERQHERRSSHHHPTSAPPRNSIAQRSPNHRSLFQEQPPHRQVPRATHLCYVSVSPAALATGCRRSGAAQPVACTDMSNPEISVGEVAARYEAGAALFDVRQPDEYVDEHAANAVLIPLNEVPDRLGEFPTDREVLVICRSGARSAMACEFLREQGIDAVNIAGGTLAWIAAGYEVVTGDQPA